ncbi:MAG TPA: tRNA (adenine-N1)-methyltransferase [Microthrixaceae bacterium]|nr:tRNA (adenine-N1)-methyltransferase [Microthrixaceae bacterium]
MSGHLAEGDLVQFLDTKGRRYQTVLTKGKEFHSHSGYVSHEEVIGLPEGSTVRTTRGQRFVVIRPTLSEFVLKMPRGAQVIYPKDLGPILMIADIGPGVRVLESGVGSGALSMAMLRAGADIVGYELREDFANRARANVEQFLGAEVLDRYRVELRDCYEGIDERDLDRVVLDLPEPWRVVPHAATALRPGGLLVSYTPSIVQVSQLRDALAKGPWFAAETVEVLQRGWYVEDQAVRPDHRMVGHTGFLTHARLAAG